MPSRFLLQTLGGLTLSACDSGSSVLVNQRKRLAFVAALAVEAKGGVSRERLFALFWSESDTERARNALNQMVFAVRRDLGDDVISGDAVSIRLNPGVIDSDVRVFRDAVASGRFADAIDAYRGPFLDGVFLRDTPEFERWVEDVRHAMAVDYVRALERETSIALSAGAARAADAVRYARLLVGCDPLSTHGALLLMRALESSGDRAAALRHAAVHAAQVRAELSSEPGPELELELARLRTNGSAGDSDHSPTARPQSLNGRSVPSEVAEISDTKRPVDETRVLRSRWRMSAAWTAAMLIVLVISVASWRRAHMSAASETNDDSRVLVASFSNRTGDSTLDYVGYIASDWVTQALTQNEIVGVVYGPTAFELSRSTPSSVSRSDSDRARLLAQRSTAGTVVSGSYYLVHDSIVITAEVTDGRTGRVLRTIPPAAAPRLDPMPAVQVVRERSVGALATVLDPRLAALSTTSSPPPLVAAYREYLEGLELFRRGKPQALSLVRFLHAAQQDSSFMLPVIWATMMASNAGKIPLRDSLQSVLRAHRASLAPIDRDALDFLDVIADSASVARQVIATGARISALAPESNWSVVQAGYLFSAGFARNALTLLERIDPERSWAGAWNTYWASLMDVQHRLGDYPAELRTADRAARVGMEAGNPELGRPGGVRALIALGRMDTAMSLVREGVPSSADVQRLKFLASAARELRLRGHRTQSDSLYGVVLDWFRARRELPDMRRLRADYIDYALQADALGAAKDAAEAVLADSADDLAAVMAAHSALGVIAARRGDRTGALAQLREVPDAHSHRVFFRWWESARKALVAGALHDREMTLRFLGEMEAQGQRGDPDAAALADWYPELSWLAGDPRIRQPYVGGIR